jgi:putative Mg2+ transporter-C (MgtC) family protein
MTLEVLGRLGAAAGCGTLLGLHVGLRKRPGGVRTHVMTTLGAALFCITAESVASDDPASALRVVQGVASGVGFIGGSVVLRRGATVQGLATGASLWIAAAIGCAAGFGKIVTALVCATFVAAIETATFYMERAFLDEGTSLRERDEST